MHAQINRNGVLFHNEKCDNLVSTDNVNMGFHEFMKLVKNIFKADLLISIYSLLTQSIVRFHKGV